MKKKDELASPDSCINRADDEEPVFVLRAHDPHAPLAVREWAQAYFRTIPYDSQYSRRMTKYMEALQLASQMETWYAAQVAAKKIIPKD